MLDFTVYKPVREDAMQQAGVATEEEFAQFFAQVISKAAGCEVTGSFTDGLVHLHTAQENMERIGDALDKRGLSYKF